jgi:undecaprenyl-diphosphatase
MPEMPGNHDLENRVIEIAGALLVVLAVATLLRRKLRRAALFWVLAIGGTLALDLLLKRVIERPSLSQGSSAYSFPSGHAMVSLAVVMACVLTAPTRWRPALAAAGALFLLAYGDLIVDLEEHYPSDVVAGWSIAFAWTAALWLLLDPGERGTPSRAASCSSRAGCELGGRPRSRRSPESRPT